MLHIQALPASPSPYIVVSCDYLAKAILEKAMAVDLSGFMVGLCRF